jgi:hypothetical protein
LVLGWRRASYAPATGPDQHPTEEEACVVDGADCSRLIELCSFKDKSDAERFCRTLTIRQADFAQFVWRAQTGELAPYRYESHFHERPIPHLIPSDAERAALAVNGVGPLRDLAEKAARKISQIFRERRYLAAHLFYTPDFIFWHLFYFDQRDIAVRDNHWRNGTHLHYASDLWINANAVAIWNQIRVGKQRFSTVHVRFVRP